MAADLCWVQTLTTDTRIWLSTTRTARVLHLFDSACNLVNRDSRVLSIVNPALGPGPFSLVLEAPCRFPSIIHLDSEIRLTGSGLEIGRLDLDLSTAQEWDPVPPWEQVTLELIKPVLPYLENALHASPTQPGISSFKLPDLEDDSSLARFSADLAGVGPGLTPSGDDVLMGVMHAIWALYPPDTAARNCRLIADTAAPKTTTLSGAWLHAAAEGKTGYPWHSLIKSMGLQETQRIPPAIDRILDTGHTSGTDTLSGFIQTIQKHLGG